MLMDNLIPETEMFPKQATTTAAADCYFSYLLHLNRGAELKDDRGVYDIWGRERQLKIPNKSIKNQIHQTNKQKVVQGVLSFKII